MTTVSKLKAPVRQTTSESRKGRSLQKKIAALQDECAELEEELKRVKSLHREKNKALRSKLKESDADRVALRHDLKFAQVELQKSECSGREKERIIDQLKRRLGEPKGISLPSPHDKFTESMTVQGGSPHRV